MRLGRAGDSSERMTYVFRKKPQTGRRFEASRWIGQSLFSRGTGWLTSTDVSTAQQKYQRAFAAEFLMPVEELKERVGADIDDETLDEIARDYNVSTLAVQSHLVNRGVIPRPPFLDVPVW